MFLFALRADNCELNDRYHKLYSLELDAIGRYAFCAAADKCGSRPPHFWGTYVTQN